MLKQVLFITLLSISSCLCSQNRILDTVKYRAYYNLIYQRDSTDINSKSKEKMTLLIGNTYSLFQSKNNEFNDSLVSSFSNTDIQDAQISVNLVLSLKKKTKFKYKIYKTPNNILVFDKIVIDKFIYKEEGKFKWVITSDTKKINNYLCQKATTTFAGRDYIAWFTNAIPISDGPYKFKGLPGLIIKIHDKREHYVFSLSSFEKYNSHFSLELNNIQDISKKEYFKAYNNFKNNIISQLEQRGITLNNPSNIKKRVKKSRNNQIELKLN